MDTKQLHWVPTTPPHLLTKLEWITHHRPVATHNWRISSLENAPMHNCDFCSIMQKICNDNNFPHCTPLWEFIILWVWLAWEGTSDWRIGWTKCLCLTYMCQIIFWNKIKPIKSSLLSIRCCLSAKCAKRIGTEMKLHNRPNRPTNRPTKTGFLRSLLYQAKEPILGQKRHSRCSKRAGNYILAQKQNPTITEQK